MQAPSTAYIAPPSAVTNLVGRTMGVDYRCTFMMWMVVMQYAILFATVWPLLVPEASRGIIDFLQRDLHISPALVSVLILFSIGITWRGIKGRWWLLLMLVGQGVYALAALAYAIHSDITLTQFAGHGGLFFLCGAGVTASIPLPRDPNETLFHFKTRLINLAKFAQIPIIGAVLMLYAVGLATRPDAGIAMFIQSQYGTPLVVVLIISLALAAGVTIQNHISASRLFVALLPQMIYSGMAISLLASDNDVSLTGVIVHMLFSITAMFIVFIQTKEYARALRLRQRQGA